MEVNDIINNISSIKDEIYNYIVDTEHWIFYWITNKEIQDMIKEYPEDYEDRISLGIESIGPSISCKISFYEHPNDLSCIIRYAVLQTFRDSVEARWLEWSGKIKDRQIKEKERELTYYKRRVAEIEKEIVELKDK